MSVATVCGSMSPRARPLSSPACVADAGICGALDSGTGPHSSGRSGQAGSSPEGSARDRAIQRLCAPEESKTIKVSSHTVKQTRDAPSTGTNQTHLPSGAARPSPLGRLLSSDLRARPAHRASRAGEGAQGERGRQEARLRRWAPEEGAPPAERLPLRALRALLVLPHRLRLGQQSPGHSLAPSPLACAARDVAWSTKSSQPESNRRRQARSQAVRPLLVPPHRWETACRHENSPLTKSLDWRRSGKPRPCPPSVHCLVQNSWRAPGG